jgi:hypothetical protein
MKICHGSSVQTLHGIIDLAKETKPKTHYITVQLMGKEPMPNATLRVSIKGDLLKPAPLDICLRKLKAATISREHASNNVPDTLFPLIVIGNHHAQGFVRLLLGKGDQVDVRDLLGSLPSQEGQ